MRRSARNLKAFRSGARLAVEQAKVQQLEVDRRAAEDARRAAEAVRAEAKYEAYKEGVAAGSCLSREVAPPGAGPARDAGSANHVEPALAQLSPKFNHSNQHV